MRRYPDLRRPKPNNTLGNIAATAISMMVGIVVVGIFLGFVLAFLSAARAHDSWISRGGLKNGAGEWCCGTGDCGVMVGGRVSAVAGGYEVDADFAIEQYDGSTLIEHVRETVPYSEAMPSPDGAYWRCHRSDGTRRCFFAGPPGS